MATTNDKITFQGKALEVTGKALAVGQSAPNFSLVSNEMSEVKLSDFDNKVLVISTIPSVDTPVCSIQTKKFNEEAANLGNDVVILTVSRDLPFAQSRWCGQEDVKNVQTASDYKERTIGQAYGTEIPSLGLLARAVFVIDKNKQITHVEYVNEIAEEPNYEAAVSAIKEAI